MAAILRVKTADGQWIDIPAVVGARGKDGKDGNDGKDGKNYEEVPAESFGIPVLSLNGDISGMNKDNAVTLSYVYGERTGTLTCKWQGSSSLAFPKKNYTIKFDNAFEAKTGWGAQTKYCLKANWVDASNVRNLIGAKIWGNLVKGRGSADARLKALPNGGAVDGFPVWLRINGEDVGIYTWNIPKDAWMFGMTGTNAGEAILCGDGCKLNQPLALDGEVMKYDDGNSNNYQQVKLEYTVSEDKSALVSSINNLISVVNNVQSENDLAALEAVLDIDSVIDYMILSGLMAHYDGITKNWILATYDGTKWFMSAYDMDGTFGNKWDGSGIRWVSDYPVVSDIGSLALFTIVRKWYRNSIKTRWTSLTGWTMNEVDLDYQVYNIAKDFPAELVARDNRLWPTRPGTMTNNQEQIINWIRIRVNRLNWDITDTLMKQ